MKSKPAGWEGVASIYVAHLLLNLLPVLADSESQLQMRDCESGQELILYEMRDFDYLKINLNPKSEDGISRWD